VDVNKERDAVVVALVVLKLTPCKSDVKNQCLESKVNFLISSFEPHHQIISPAEAGWLAQLSQKYLMADQQHPPTPDPPIYKLLSPKTQGLLRATAKQREEAARLHDDTMSNEQT